jgi:beta-lactamase class A
MTDPRFSSLDAIAARAEAAGAIVGIAVIGPDGARFSRHGDRRFHAASTMKIQVMVEIFRQIERGNLTLRDLVTLDDADKVGGTGVLHSLHDGLALSVGDLLYLMIAISDNTATNLLIDLASREAIVDTMRELGMTTSGVERKMLGRLPQGDEPENWATPDDYATLMHAIVTDSAAAPESCAAMRALLGKQQCQTRFRRLLPADAVWGSKLGSLAGVCNDVGFVAGPGGTVSIAIFVEGLPELEAEPVIGELVREAARIAGALPD